MKRLALTAIIPAAFTLALFSGPGDLSASGRCEQSDLVSLALGKNPGMVAVPAGTFVMGKNDERREEKSEHLVSISGFQIDRYEVTNAEFAKFVDETGYRTTAETGLDPKIFPGLPDVFYQAGAMVFRSPGNGERASRPSDWWSFVKGANWRHPTGPDSNIDGLENHPVVQVSYNDALAYARWKGRDLPTEAEWEYAARGGLKGKKYTWGDSYLPVDGWKANTWQGAFPVQNTSEDGHYGTAPVGCYEANGYGIYDMAGNVWEYARDLWRPYHTTAMAKDPIGPDLATSAQYARSGVPDVVIKGGSWLCAPNFCMRFRPSARQPQEIGLGTNHIGFRTVLRDRL